MVVGFALGAKLLPFSQNTMEDSGALPLEFDVSDLNTGDIIDIYPYEGVTKGMGRMKLYVSGH